MLWCGSWPDLKTVDVSCSAVDLKPAVPYDGVKVAGLGNDDEASRTCRRSDCMLAWQGMNLWLTQKRCRLVH